MTIQGHEIAGRMPLFTKENREKSVDKLKTMTRRPMKVQPPEKGDNGGAFLRVVKTTLPGGIGYDAQYELDNPKWIGKAPYKVGDIRVMCEPLKFAGDTFYADDKERVFTSCVIDGIESGAPLEWRWKVETLSSRYMPHEAARYLFEITDIRAERLQDISEEDAIAEGVPKVIYCPACEGEGEERPDGCCICEHTGRIKVGENPTYSQLFADLWDSIYGKTHPWADNDMVWVYTYKAVT